MIRLGMVAPVLMTDQRASPWARTAFIMGDGFKGKGVAFVIVPSTTPGFRRSVRSVNARGQVGSGRALVVCNEWLARGGPACLPPDGGAFRARVMLCRSGSPVGRRGPPGRNLYPFYTRSEGFCLLVCQAPTPLLCRLSAFAFLSAPARHRPRLCPPFPSLRSEFWCGDVAVEAVFPDRDPT